MNMTDKEPLKELGLFRSNIDITEQELELVNLVEGPVYLEVL